MPNDKKLEKLSAEEERLRRITEEIELKKRIDAQHKKIANSSWIDWLDYQITGKTYRNG